MEFPEVLNVKAHSLFFATSQKIFCFQKAVDVFPIELQVNLAQPEPTMLTEHTLID